MRFTRIAVVVILAVVVGHLWANSSVAAEGAVSLVVRTAKSGAWSAGETWEGGKPPAAGETVLVRTGHKVEYDVQSDAVLRAVNVAGTLSFVPNKNTRLCVGLLKVQATEECNEDGFDCEADFGPALPNVPRPGLEVGTPERPIEAKHTAVIRLTYVAGMDKQSCPALVCCGARLDLHGSPLDRTWVKLGATAQAGDVQITAADSIAGWKVGDRIVITGTSTHEHIKAKSSGEERLVQAVAGQTITVDKPLEFMHAGEGEFRGEIANLTRNVVVESADPAGERGHTMYHRGSAGSLSYSEFRHLGKRNVLGRYSLHFHRVGDTMRGSSVIGNSIWDSHNRWLTIHGTNYLVARDNVGYRSVGHGFFLEDGTEVFNVLDRNLAIAAEPGKRLPKQVLPFDQNEGAGFWWANSLNTFTRNVAAECGQYGFRYEATASSDRKLEFEVQQPNGSSRRVDIRTLPFVRCDDNEVHSSNGLYGFNLGEGVNRVGPDRRHPFIIRNLKIWDVHYGLRPQAPSLLVENLTLYRAHYGIYHPNYDNHAYRNVSISYSNTEPFNRGHDDVSAQYGLLTVDGLTFNHCRSGGMPLIQISDDNPTGQAVSHFRNVQTNDWTDSSREKAIANLGGGPRPTPKTPQGVSMYFHDWFGAGRHAQVCSVKSGEYQREANAFREVPPLTGDQSRAREVSKVEFPQAVDPIDDLPPTTVITHHTRSGDKIRVRGVTADNGDVKEVLVNGQPARSTRPNFAEWEIELPLPAQGSQRLEALATDVAGNREPRPMVLE